MTEDRSENRLKIDSIKKDETTSGHESKQAMDDLCNDLHNNPRLYALEVHNHHQAMLDARKWTDRNSKSYHSQAFPATSEPLKIKSNKIMPFKCEIGVTSITLTGDNSAWIMYFESNIMYLYNSSGDAVRSIIVESCYGINNLVIRRSGEMIITCTGDKKVRYVSMSGEVSTLINTHPFRPSGLCLTDKKDLVVCMGSQKEKNHVAVYSPDTGVKLHEIRGIDDQGKQHITAPYRVVCNGKDLCVVNVNPDVVVCVNEKCNAKWIYDGREANLTKSFDPRGISVDKYNNLLVTDFKNHCVHYIDREGRLIQIILTQEQTGLCEHWGICVDNNIGQVWVGDTSKNVIVCKYSL